MQYDANLMFDDGVTTALSGASPSSPNSIKVPNGGVFINQGLGEPTIIDAQITTLLVTATQCTLQLFAAPDNAGSPGTWDTLPLNQADFQAAGVKSVLKGARAQLMVPPLPVNRPWLKLVYKGDAAFGGGNIFATIVPAEQVAVP